MTSKDLNKNNLENNETPKVVLENIQEKEISPEEFLNIANNEEQKFKQETNEEVSKLNSVNLDQSIFENIKNETNVEKDLNAINTESVTVINEAKDQVKNPQQKTMAEMRAPNITKKLKDIFPNEQDFSEANRIALKINDLVESLPEDKQKDASEKLRQLLNSKDIYFYKELHDNILEDKKRFESLKQDVENKSFTNAKDFDEVIKQIDIMSGVQGSSEFFTPDMIKNVIQGVRSGERKITDVTSAGGLRQKIAVLLAEPDPTKAVRYESVIINGESRNIQTQYFNDPDKIKVNLGRGWEIMSKDDFSKLHQESEKVQNSQNIITSEKAEIKIEEPLSKDDALKEMIYTQGMSVDQIKAHMAKSPEERKRLRDSLVIEQENSENEIKPATQKLEQEAPDLSVEINKTEEQTPKKEEKQPVDTEYNETLLLGKKLSNFPEAVQEKYRESVEKYSTGLNTGMQEKDENGLTLVDKIKNNIRSDYDVVMNKLGILSSPAGTSDNWIYWDLGKQSYFSEHPDESNENYNLANPFSTENQEITKDIINRHVGWEVLGYAKNNPEFLNGLDKNKDSYLKITSLINEGARANKLSSYKLAELGKLVQENKEV